MNEMLVSAGRVCDGVPDRRIDALWRLGALFLALVTVTACYDPNEIQSLSASPDGRYLAIHTAHNELGLLDLETGAPLSIYSHYLGRGLAWSPDSHRLLFIEQFPSQPSALWVLNLETRRRERPLAADPSWKADPVWLADGRVAYLTDLDAEVIRVRVIDPASGRTAWLLERDTDISRLWASPRGEYLVYQSIEAGANELWLWRPADETALHLASDRFDAAVAEQCVAFSRDGRRVAFVTRPSERREIQMWDLEPPVVLASLALPRPPGSLAFLGGDAVAIPQGDRLFLWRPLAPWWRGETARSQWGGIRLGPVAPWGGSEGLALAANGNLLLTAPDPARLESATLHVRTIRDLIKLADVHARLGRRRQARALLEAQWARAPGQSLDRVAVAIARGRLARLEKKWREADQWLGRGLNETRPDTPEGIAIQLERLALAAFDRRRDDAAFEQIERLTAAAARAPLADWLRGSAGEGSAQARRAWLAIGGHVRQGRYAAAAAAIQEAVANDDWTTTGLRALSLIIDGDLEPTAIDESDQNHLPELLAHPAFKLALLRASRLAGAEPAENYREMLLVEWVRRGDLDSARMVVGEDLEGGSTTLDYAGMLRQYLITEEQEPWIERAVAEVFLAPAILPRLESRLDQPGDREALWLAAAKAALIEGDYEAARRANDRARELILDPPASLAPLPEEERNLGLFLVSLFEAKILERRGAWEATIKAYRHCLNLMEREPGDYDIAPFEVANAIGVIEAGRGDADLLRLYLTTLRGLGDPLINPTHDPNTLNTALSNLETLRRIAPDRWLLPYLTYSQGACFSLLGRPWRALTFLQSTRGLRPADSLTQRILLEEGALRETLGQHALAARLYGQILETVQPVPVKALVMQAVVQAETAAGLIGQPAPRLAQLLVENPLPAPWRDWLYLQFGLEGPGEE